MTRLFLFTICFSLLLSSCDDKSAHRPATPFVYTILDNVTLTNGKNSFVEPLEPGFEVNDIVYDKDEGEPWRVLEIDHNRKFNYLMLPMPEQYISRWSSVQSIFKAYHSGDTLILAQAEDLPDFPAVSNNCQDFKRARAMNEYGKVVIEKVKNTDSVGGHVFFDYTIRKLLPYTETVEIDYDEEIRHISGNPASPTLLQAYKWDGGTIHLEPYQPQNSPS